MINTDKDFTESMTLALSMRWILELKLCWDAQFNRSPTKHEFRVLVQIISANFRQQADETRKAIAKFRNSPTYDEEMRAFTEAER